MKNTIEIQNFKNWCMIWNKKPYQYSTLKEYLFETMKYKEPICEIRGDING